MEKSPFRTILRTWYEMYVIPHANYVRCPTHPKYRMRTPLWRVAILNRLALPLTHLRAPQSGCACHDRYDAKAHGRRSRRRRPKPVDVFREHDQRCSLTFTLGRHDEVQETALRPTLKTNGFLVSSSKTSELRKPGDANDFSRKKGDLSTIGLFHEAKDILDIGITHPTIDSSLNTLSSVVRGTAANKMAKAKDDRANAIIADKELDVGFKAITFGSYGGFGKGSHQLISKVTANVAPPPLSTTLGSSLGLKPTPTWSLASPLREQMPACSSTPMLNAAALRTLFVPLAHGPLRLPKRDAGAP